MEGRGGGSDFEGELPGEAQGSKNKPHRGSDLPVERAEKDLSLGTIELGSAAAKEAEVLEPATVSRAKSWA